MTIFIPPRYLQKCHCLAALDSDSIRFEVPLHGRSRTRRDRDRSRHRWLAGGGNSLRPQNVVTGNPENPRRFQVFPQWTNVRPHARAGATDALRAFTSRHPVSHGTSVMVCIDVARRLFPGVIRYLLGALQAWMNPVVATQA